MNQVWLFSVGIAQGIFLSAAIFSLRVKNKTAARLFAAQVAVLTVALSNEFFQAIIPQYRFPFGLSLEFAFWPCVLLFMRSLGWESVGLKKPDLYHFAPFAVTSIILFTVYLFNRDGLAHPIFSFWIVAKLAYFIVYAIFADRMMQNAINGARRRRRTALAWLQYGYRALFGLVAIIYAADVISRFSAFNFIQTDYLSSLVTVAAIFGFAYFLLLDQKIFNAEPICDQNSADLALQAEAYLRDNPEATTNCDLTLEELAGLTGIPVSVLTQSLNAKYDGGFHELLNQQRITLFDQLIRQPENRTRTILELAFDAGFASKATFYRAFRAIKNMTPSAYRAQLADNQGISASHPSG